ncbi:MAG: hypothetical protein J7599_06595 [Niabella sp.]|nr:hypothetical protein [Niabella sp.]
MSNAKKLCFFLMLILVFSKGHSQKFKEIVGPSPAAAVFSKYTDIPVNNYTGVPNIEIPIYKIQANDLEVPVSLSYHAGGFRVDEEAGRSGLGWALNAGGVISRSVNGEDDFLPIRGYLNNSIPGFWGDSVTHAIQVGNNMFKTSQADLEMNKFVVNLYSQQLNLTQYLPSRTSPEHTTYDMEPDVFSFNFNGISGKFTIKKNKEVELQSPSGIKIKLLNNDGSGWLITTPNGVKYYFEKTENCEFLSGGAPKRYITTWYLTKIASPNGNAIMLDYVEEGSLGVKTYTTINEKYTMEVDVRDTPGYDAEHRTGSRSTTYPPIKVYSPVFLKAIKFPLGSVTFDYSDRVDVKGDKRLSKIFINNFSHPSSSFYYEFLYDYFTSDPSGYTMPDPETNLDQDLFNKRLKLIGLEKKNVSAISSNEKFQFYYNSLNLPSKKSLARDFWGFYNGQISNSSLLPNGSYPSYKNIGQVITFTNGGNRQASEIYSKASILNEIVYPTGGKTRFEFESNDYDISNSSSNGPGSPGAELVTEQKDFFTRRGSDDSFEVSFPTTFQGSRIIFNINSENGQPVSFPYPRDDDAFFEIYAASNLTTPVVRSLLGYESFWVKDETDPYNLKYRRDDQFLLPKGNYVIKTHIASTVSFLNYVRFSFKYNYYKDIEGNHAIEKGGGIRVSRITNFNAASEVANTKRFEYHYNRDYDGNGLEEKCSYGRRLSPVGSTSFELTIGQTAASDGSTIYTQVLHNLFSQSAFSGGQSIVGYDKVKVSEGDVSSEIGYSEFEYINVPDIVPVIRDEANGQYDFRSPTLNTIVNLSNGSLLKEAVYIYNSDKNSFLLRREMSNSYSDSLKNTHAAFMFYDVYGGRSVATPSSVAGWGLLQYPAFKATWSKLKSQTIKEFPCLINDEIPLISRTDYEYESTPPKHFMPIQTTKNNSDGTVTSKIDIYPDDYDSATLWINDMKLANIKYPIEQIEFVNNKAISGRAYLYKVGGKGILEKQQNVYSNVSIPLSTFKFSNRPVGVVPPSGVLSPFFLDVNYKDFLQYNLYSTDGNVLERQLPNNVREVYLWGYNNQYPVAKIAGADFATVNLVIDTILINNPDITDNQLRTELSKLRTDTRTQNAQVSTYTYRPLVGMTSETDPAGRTTFYEYDAFGRLSLVKDEDGNILKRICYNYAGQVTDCGPGLPAASSAQWIATGTTRCVKDGSNNNTGYQEREERDNNATSETYNQVRWINMGSNTSTCPLPNNGAQWVATGNTRCVKDGGNNNTGSQEREERDNNATSGTYNQTRWVNTDTNTTACPLPSGTSPDWQATGNTRCVKDGSNNNTGTQEREERDQNTSSATYNQTRWVSTGTNTTACPLPNSGANWQATGTTRCVKDGSNNNTGYQEREERDNNTTSSTYNQTRWVSTGENTTACPLPATAPNWQPTGAIRCEAVDNINTGNQERKEVDMNTASTTYMQERWVSTGANATACPLNYRSVSYINKSDIAFTLTFTNVSNNQTYIRTASPTSPTAYETLMNDLPPATYNITAVPESGSTTMNFEFVVNGMGFSIPEGSSMNLEGVMITHNATFRIEPHYDYMLSSATGFNTQGGVFCIGSRSVIDITVTNQNALVGGQTYLIGTIAGCRPSTTESLMVGRDGSSWVFLIMPNGEIYIVYPEGAIPAGTTQVFSGLVYYR